MKDYTTSFTVDQTPEEVFAAIKNVRAWWTGEVKGSADKLADEFTYQYEDLHYSKQKVTELLPGRRIAWLVTEADIMFVRDKREWKGTQVTFDISRESDKTEVRFTHVGLVPQMECYSSCSQAWGYYVMSSLRNLITSGNGNQASS
jgi:hypothetical protein